MLPLTRRQLLAAPGVLAAAPPKPPNIITLVTDDQGYGDLSLHGNPHLRTPHVDSLAHDGAQLTQFHVSPVCAPTRASLMTGRYNYRTGVVDTYLGRALMYPDEVTLPEILSRAGYRTGIFGKWHLGDNYPLRSIDQGFQESLVHHGGGIKQPSDPPGSGYFDPVLSHNGKLEQHAGYCTDVFTEAALQFVEQNRNRPFYCHLATNAPHDPLEVAEKYAAPFRAQGLDEQTARTYGMLANLDENVGRLLGKLKALALERDTIVVYCSDNGPQRARYNAGMRGIKGTVYEGGIRVPCFIRWPARIAPGRQIDRVSAHIDVLPTLLAACQLPAPANIDGRSLLPLLAEPTSAWPDRTLFFQWHRGETPVLFRNCAARTQQYKLIDGRELYDLAADPREEHDLAAAQPTVVARLRHEMEQWFTDVSASRGYAPPRIVLGDSHENPVVLTRQDWRGPRAGWEADSLGHWEVQIARSGPYAFVVTLPSGSTATKASLTIAAEARTVTIAPGTASCFFTNVPLNRGPARLQVTLMSDSATSGPQSISVRH